MARSLLAFNVAVYLIYVIWLGGNQSRRALVASLEAHVRSDEPMPSARDQSANRLDGIDWRATIFSRSIEIFSTENHSYNFSRIMLQAIEAAADGIGCLI